MTSSLQSGLGKLGSSQYLIKVVGAVMSLIGLEMPRYGGYSGY